MVENGLYIIKREFIDIISKISEECDIISGDKRPVFCCIKDNKIEGLFWAIPTSDLSHRDNEQREYYNLCLNCKEDDLRSCYYHLAKTTKDALYKISSCYPIIDKYIDHEFISNKKHVIMKKQKDILEIRRKFRRILSMESRNPNYFKQHITDIKNFLIEELKKGD